MSSNNLFSNIRIASWLFVLLPLSLCEVHAQSQTQKVPNQDEVVSVKTNLVNIDVIVKDKKGKFISDLNADDFTVFENGVQQKVEFFDPPLTGGNEVVRRNAVVQATSAAPGRLPRNIVSLVLDGQTTDLTNLKQVRDGTLRYIRERISDSDTVAIFAVTSGLQLLQPFTQDKTKLVSAVETAYSTSTSSKNFEQRDLSQNIDKLREQSQTPIGPIATAAAGSSAAQAMIAARILQQYVKLRTALSVQQSRPILAALAAICDGQRTIPGKKTLVLFSQGFVAPAVLDWQVQSTIDIANRANVTIYIIDSAGLREGGTRSGSLVPGSPLAGVSAVTNQEQRIQAVGGETVFDYVRHEGLNREYDILYRISGDTGGKFIKGTNDISVGLDRIDHEIRSRYTLAYRSTDQNFDGNFRKLKVEVRRSDAQVISRAGYYAIPHEDLVLLSPEDKKLLTNFAAAEAKPGLSIFVELTPLRSAEGFYTVPLSIEMPPDTVKFDQKGDKQLLQLDVLGVVRATSDKILSRLGGSFDVGLTAAQYQSILNNNIFYRQDLQLPAGTYSIDVIVRDRLSGKIAAMKQKLVLPEMGSEFEASPVVLSSHAASAKGFPSANGPNDVLSEGGVRIRPSPGHEFRASDNLVMFFELYNAATSTETAKSLVRVTVTLIKDNKAARRPIDYVLTEVDNQPVPHLTFAKYMSLEGLATGNYVAMIEARDMVTRKLVKQEAPFVIVQ